MHVFFDGRRNQEQSPPRPDRIAGSIPSRDGPPPQPLPPHHRNYNRLTNINLKRSISQSEIINNHQESIEVINDLSITFLKNLSWPRCFMFFQHFKTTNYQPRSFASTVAPLAMPDHMANSSSSARPMSSREKHMGLFENNVPLNPMVLLIIIPIKWLFHWEYTQHFQTNPHGEQKSSHHQMFHTTYKWSHRGFPTKPNYETIVSGGCLILWIQLSMFFENDDL